MNINPQTSGIGSVLRAEIEAWRKACNVSREGVAVMVMEQHILFGGEAATGVDFDFTGDTYSAAKKAAQKLFRWLDVDGALPAGILQSVLAALPMDVRLHCMNQIFRPLGAEARSTEVVRPGRFDGMSHLKAMIKEGGEAKSAVVIATTEQTPQAFRTAIKEVAESIQADVDAKRCLEAALLAAELGVEMTST